MKTLCIYLILFTIIFSCTSEKSKSIYNGKMIELIPWINREWVKEVNLPDHPYAAFVDSVHEFSYGFKVYYKDIQPAKPKKIEVSCLIYPYNMPNNVQLVLEMKENDTNIFWKSEKIKTGKVGQWNEVTLTADIPQNLPPNVLIQIYLWSPNRESALGDNFLIKFE
ncbi:MAG: hypothetical protein N2449_01950 [Bacteroidales bacterium]|nr:hypothetical protein [Bacteroidales bacterium]